MFYHCSKNKLGKKILKVFQLKNNICFKWPCLGFAPARRFTTFPNPAADFWKQKLENGRSRGSKAMRWRERHAGCEQEGCKAEIKTPVPHPTTNDETTHVLEINNQLSAPAGPNQWEYLWQILWVSEERWLVPPKKWPGWSPPLSLYYRLVIFLMSSTRLTRLPKVRETRAAFWFPVSMLLFVICSKAPRKNSIPSPFSLLP